MRVRARRGYYPRRTNQPYSYNTLPPAQSQPGDAGGGQSLREAGSPTTLKPSANQTQAPARSKRKGPSETDDGAEPAKRSGP